MAYVYPRKMRSPRDLLRPRNHLLRKRSELLAHIQNSNSQYNLPEFGKKLAYKGNREGVAERFPDPSVRKSIEVDLELLDCHDQLLNKLELYVVNKAKVDDIYSWYRLRSIPGVGKILGLVLLYVTGNPPRTGGPERSKASAKKSTISTAFLARIFHELLSRDREDGLATGQPRGVGSEAYLNGTLQGPTPKDTRKGGHIRGRSR